MPLPWEKWFQGLSRILKKDYNEIGKLTISQILSVLNTRIDPKTGKIGSRSMDEHTLAVHHRGEARKLWIAEHQKLLEGSDNGR